MIWKAKDELSEDSSQAMQKWVEGVSDPSILDYGLEVVANTYGCPIETARKMADRRRQELSREILLAS